MMDTKSPFAPFAGLLGPEPNTPLSSLPDEERERIVRKRQAISEQEEIAWQKVEIEQTGKLLLLCKHYNIEVEGGINWPFMLCNALANEFFAGMKVDFEQRKGRKRKWNTSEYLELWAAIENIKIDRKCGDTDACRTYTKRTHGRANEKKAKYYVDRLKEAKNPKFNRWAIIFKGKPEHRRDMIEVLIGCFGPGGLENAASRAELNKKHGTV